MPEGPCHSFRLKASWIHPKPVFFCLPTVVSLPLQSNGPFDQGLEEKDGIKCSLLCNSQVHSDLSRGSPLHLRTYLILKNVFLSLSWSSCFFCPRIPGPYLEALQKELYILSPSESSTHRTQSFCCRAAQACSPREAAFSVITCSKYSLAIKAKEKKWCWEKGTHQNFPLVSLSLGTYGYSRSQTTQYLRNPHRHLLCVPSLSS